jgi:hypothetical protein
MVHFGEEEGVMHLSLRRFFHAGQRHPRGLAPWVDLERDGLKDAVFHGAIPQPDREGLHAMDHRPLTFEQESRPFGRTRHHWLFLPI